VGASVGVRDGIIWSKSFQVLVEVLPHEARPKGEWSEGPGYTLIASAESVSKFWPSRRTGSSAHPDYVIGRPDGCEICVLGYVEFTPYADPGEIARLTDFDLSCLTRWRYPCRTQSDIMPVAWAQYNGELAATEETALRGKCTSAVVEYLGRDADGVVSATVMKTRPEGDATVATVRLDTHLKGAHWWADGSFREVEIFDRMVGLGIRDRSTLRPGTPLVLLFDHSHIKNHEEQYFRLEDCGVELGTAENIAIIRRGISRDYAAVVR
jgi:hypothetical protein